jgi:aminopeptidase N
VRRSKAERARKELPEVLRINREGVKFFEDYFAHEFPFPKYDLVVIPEFAYNGMEHAGATFLREEGVLFPSDPTDTDLAVRAELLLHEAAHQWFGDLVTMRWFDDLWLKEGFATFMAYKAAERVMPKQDAWKVFHLRTKPLAYLTDVTKGTTPIWQEIPNLSAAKSAYGNIVYRKAPAVLRQAEFYLGADTFRRAVRAFVRDHAYANAEWADLVRAFERASNRELSTWADAWVRRRGMPDVRVIWGADARGRVKRFKLVQQDVLGEGGAWPLKIEVGLVYAGGRREEARVVQVVLDGRGETTVAGVVGREAPAYVFANSGDYGYGRFLLDDVSRAHLLRRQTWGDTLDDTLILSSLWESVREAELAPLDYVELGMRFMSGEHEDVTLQPVLTRVQWAVTRYLSDAQRAAVAPRLERLIFERMQRAGTAGQRIAYYRAFRDIASTAEARGDLLKILSGEIEVPGVALRPRDRFDIARALLAAGGDGKDERAEAVFKSLRERDATDDGRRYAYAAEAARPLAAVKDRYFRDFTHNAELPESWIEAAFVPFNSPQQSALTLPHLESSLRELPRLKRARKIFFVNGWLAAFIGGQCSPQAMSVVDDFLRRETTLDRDLRLKVLEAADGLGRCVRIRDRYAGKASGVK